MSDAAAEKAPAAAAPAGIPMKMVIIIVAGVLVLALGGAFAMVKMMGGSSAEKAASEGGAEKAGGHGEAEAKGGHSAVGEAVAIADLDPFIVNLADSPEVRYLKVTMKLELTNSAAVDDIAARTPQIRDAILVLLTSLDSVAARSPQGKHKLREDVTQRVNGLLPKKSVKTAYFTDFVIQ